MIDHDRDVDLPWVDGLSVGSVLRRTAHDHDSRDALVFPFLAVRWTWAELDRRVDAVASGFLSLGIEAGDHVGVWAMNGPEWIVAQFASARIGAVLVNINPAYRLHELEDALRTVDVATLLVGSPYKSSDFVGMVESLAPEIAQATGRDWTSGRLPALRRVVSFGPSPGPGWLEWAALESADLHPDLAAREAAVSPVAVQNIQFTSGTTGLPKGAMLTHRNVLLNAYYVGRCLRYTPEDRVCVPVPFYHCFGCVLGNLVCAVHGSAIVVPAPSFDALSTLRAIEAERCTSVYGVPTMFSAMLDRPERPSMDLSSLRTGIMAGSPCPLPLMKEVMNVLGASQITIGYGQTEASPIITQTDVDDSPEVRSGTVGRVLPGVDVRIVDPATGRDVAEGEAGELCAQGHGVMLGYYQNPQATARAIDPEGWLHTGDLAIRRPDDTYRIVGRCKELIIRGGENIYPPEVEEFLHHHPAVAEVAVVGLPDALYGEVVSAWVVPRSGFQPTPEELRDYCRGQIAHYKIPAYVIISDALPKTVTGKIRKHLLRTDGIQRFGLAEAGSVETA